MCDEKGFRLYFAIEMKQIKMSATQNEAIARLNKFTLLLNGGASKPGHTRSVIFPTD